MKWEEIEELDPTASDNISLGILIDILTTDRGWVYWQGDFEPETPRLIGRYLASHARVPGLLTDTVAASQVPIDIVQTTWEPQEGKQATIKGFVFLNGAVLRLKTEQSFTDYLLMSKDDAEFWAYPASAKSAVDLKG